MAFVLKDIDSGSYYNGLFVMGDGTDEVMFVADKEKAHEFPDHAAISQALNYEVNAVDRRGKRIKPMSLYTWQIEKV